MREVVLLVVNEGCGLSRVVALSLLLVGVAGVAVRSHARLLLPTVLLTVVLRRRASTGAIVALGLLLRHGLALLGLLLGRRVLWILELSEGGLWLGTVEGRALCLRLLLLRMELALLLGISALLVALLRRRRVHLAGVLRVRRLLGRWLVAMFRVRVLRITAVLRRVLVLRLRLLFLGFSLLVLL